MLGLLKSTVFATQVGGGKKPCLWINRGLGDALVGGNKYLYEQIFGYRACWWAVG